ncbi:MAG: hypothetical protein JSV92_04880 [archaeon]|nr:MAG: hypothetical protein JSV92_04880 [archaeon]
MTEKLAIWGLGTVGNNSAHIYLGAHGGPVIGVKRTANPDDVNTKNLLWLYDNFGKSSIDLYITPGEDYKDRKEDFEYLGMEVIGSTDDIDFSEIGYIIDCSPKHTEVKNYKNIFSKHPGIRLMLQGGGDDNLVNGRNYLSVENATGHLYFEDYSQKSIKQVSCNTSGTGNGLSDILKVETPENIKRITTDFTRRQKDPGMKPGEPLRDGLKTEEYSHHFEDVIKVFPQLKGKLRPSEASMGPWTHYHKISAKIDFYRPFDFEGIVKEFEKDPRLAFMKETEGEREMKERILRGERREKEKVVKMDMDEILKLSKKNGIRDGDCLIPIYYAEKIDDTEMKFVCIVPQRSVPCPSILNMLTKVFEKPDATWEEVNQYNNQHAKWYGHSFQEIKKIFEEKLPRPEPKSI